ncbi:unnamed protein product, partial [Heterotrigona itama]
RGCSVIVWSLGPQDCVSVVASYTMCTADAWRIAKTTNYGILPRIMAFRRQRTDGLRTALRTNSFAAFTGQSDSRATYSSTIRQLIMELENCNSHGDHVPPQHENDPSGNKKWYRQASQRNHEIRVNHRQSAYYYLRRVTLKRKGFTVFSVILKAAATAYAHHAARSCHAKITLR